MSWTTPFVWAFKLAAWSVGVTALVLTALFIVFVLYAIFKTFAMFIKSVKTNTTNTTNNEEKAKLTAVDPWDSND